MVLYPFFVRAGFFGWHCRFMLFDRTKSNACFVMTRLINSRAKQPQASKAQAFVVAALIVVLAMAVLTCAGLLAVPLWTAFTENW
jgi:hypothetical protein